jgi:hypothetical protein
MSAENKSNNPLVGKTRRQLGSTSQPKPSNPKSVSALTGYCIFFGAIIVIILVVIFLNTGSIFSKSFIHDTFHGWNDNSAASKSQTVSASQTHGITVKGFYIGMPKDDILKVGKDLYGWELRNQVADYTNEVDVQYELPNPNEPFSDGEIRFILDSNYRLKTLVLGYVAVNNLFKSYNMNSQEFAQQFANSYNIPEFKHRQTPSGDWQWVYTSPDSIAITITDEKDLIINRDTSQQDIQKNFN